MNFFVMESMMDKDCSWRVDEWKGCYPSSWKGTIIPEAISHPAKFSSRLIRRIYEHMQGEGWVKAGDTVLDPFGGVALGALDAMRLGLRWRGIELEQKFHDLGNGNIFHWNVRFERMPHWSGDAVLLKGDSRKLLEVLGEGGAQNSVSSPPYAETPVSQTHMTSNKRGDPDNPNYRPSWKTKLEAGFADTERPYGTTDGQLGSMKAGGFDAALSSPPYSEARIGQESGQGQCGRGDQYGGSDGQLGAMKGDGFEAAVSSPPFEQRSADGGWQMLGKYAEEGRLTVKQVKGDKSKSYPSWGKKRDTSYGEADGQMSNMKGTEDGFSAAISSPPFGTTVLHDGGPVQQQGGELHSDYGATEGQLANMEEGSLEEAISGQPSAISAAVSSPPFVGVGVENDGRKEILQKGFNASGAEGSRPNQVGDYKKNSYTDSYGVTEGQLGNETTDDFWLAARQIVDQVYQALEPGGKAVWVCKDFVKNKERVPFSNQWRQLCEAVGFVTLHEHHAMLVNHKSTSITLEGEHVENKVASKSFFRRLAEKNGSPKIDWETIWCMEKTAEA